MARTADKAGQLWGELLPVIGFIAVYNGLRIVDLDSALLNKETALFWATGVLIALMFGVVGWKLAKKEPVPLFLVVSSLVVGGFGLLGILFQEKSFIYIKPTIQQLFLASLILGSLLLGKNIWKVMFNRVFDLPDFAWNTLAIRWGGYFVAMALWNEYLWRTYVPGFEISPVIAGIPVAPAGTYDFLGLTFGAKDAEDVWANWKLWNMGITLAFAAANVPYTLKHLRDAPAADRPNASA
jgi:intracellular septation protein